jgi:CDP-diglyceride synthetase
VPDPIHPQTSEAASPAGPSRRAVFVRRLLSTLGLWALILGAMFSGNERVSNTVFILIITLLALVGLAEFYGMARRRGLICFHRLGIAAGVLLVAGTFWLLTGRTGAGGSAPSAGEFESIFFIAVVLGLGIRMLAAQSEPRGIAAFAVTEKSSIGCPTSWAFATSTGSRA